MSLQDDLKLLMNMPSKKPKLNAPSIPCELCTSSIIDGHMYKFQISVSTALICSDCYELVRYAERVEIRNGEFVR